MKVADFVAGYLLKLLDLCYACLNGQSLKTGGTCFEHRAHVNCKGATEETRT